MSEKDIRWKQRFENYQKALKELTYIVNEIGDKEPSNIERLSIIKMFEIVFELSWKVMQDFLIIKGAKEIYGSKDVFRNAFQKNIISDGQVWMNMIEDRNLTVHTYDENTAKILVEKILDNYYGEFLAFQTKMESME